MTASVTLTLEPGIIGIFFELTNLKHGLKEGKISVVLLPLAFVSFIFGSAVVHAYICHLDIE